jgi:hypothetical protein
MDNANTRYGVVYWRGRSCRFKSFRSLDAVREFNDRELSAHNDVKVLKYHRDVYTTSYVKEKMLAELS